MTETESRAGGLGGLHVHHVDGRGVRAKVHDQALLEVRCQPCHVKTMRGTPKPTWRERRDQQRAR